MGLTEEEQGVRVSDPDPLGFGVFAWIKILFSNVSGSDNLHGVKEIYVWKMQGSGE